MCVIKAFSFLAKGGLIRGIARQNLSILSLYIIQRTARMRAKRAQPIIRIMQATLSMILALLTRRVITLKQGFLSFPLECSIHIIGKERFKLLTRRDILSEAFSAFPLNARSTSLGRESSKLPRGRDILGKAFLASP
jgi:hypothetical protein